jgi:hypothetical protein
MARLLIAISLALAWANLLSTARWADLPGALHGWKLPWYAAALAATTILFVLQRRRIGQPVSLSDPGGFAPADSPTRSLAGAPEPRSVRALSLAAYVLLAAGATLLVGGLFSRLPLSSWTLIPFLDDWTPLYQEAANGVALLRRGVVVGWNWWFLGGYPTSTEIAQSFAVHAFLPIALFGERIGYHLVHAMFFFSLPVLVWWDVRQEDRTLGLVAAGFACLFVTGVYGTLGVSGDTNSLAGLFSATLALAGSRAARLGRRWGGPVLLLGLTLGLYSHVAFFVYTLIYLALEVIYYRDRAAALRVVAAAAFAGLAALPLHWESLRYPSYLIVNNTVYDPDAPVPWDRVLRGLYYNVEILAFPHRWFNDYRSLVNVWWPAILALALSVRLKPDATTDGRSVRLQPDPSRVGFYAWAVLLTQFLLRLNTTEFGVIFDRIMHMFPVLAAPALAGVVLRLAGSRALAIAMTTTIALYVQSNFAPIRHVDSLRDFGAAFTERLAGLDGALVLVELSPHFDMDSDPARQSPKTPFESHFDALLPTVAGQRIYGQMWDGWVWNVFRRQVVGAGTFRGRPLAETPIGEFADEMRRWGVRHLLVWTPAAKAYLAGMGPFAERWRTERWTHFELTNADVRSVVTPRGGGELRALDFLGADVVLTDVFAGDLVVVRANYYPAWRASSGDAGVPLFSSGGQLAFQAPRDGSYTVRLEYPRRRGLSLLALAAFLIGAFALSRSRRKIARRDAEPAEPVG